VRGLDTNVLIRFFHSDDPKQSELVRALFELARGERKPFYVSSIVLCEVVWVLKSFYRKKREEICSTLDLIFALEALEIEDFGLASLALEDYRTGEADFADYLIGRRNRKAGCRDTVTFDRDLEVTSGFTILR
jgi:predicted nucleic-acid-binding protein